MSIGMRGRGRTLAALMAAALATGAAAGCGSDDQSEAGASAGLPKTAAAEISCGAGTGKPATGEPIKVGAVVGQTGPADFSSAAKAAEAYFECVNADGGIDGRPVEYLVEDDKWDPAVAARAARKLVEDDAVVAMVGSTSFVECGANAAYYAKQGIAVVAGVGVPRECFHSANIAPTNQGPRLSGIGAAQLAKENGAKSIACISNVIPNFGGWACKGMQAWGEREGVTVKTFLGKPDASDAESVVLKALQAKTDAVVPVDAAPPTAAYLKVGQDQGSGGPEQPWFLPTAAYNTSFPETVGAYWNDKLNISVELAPLDEPGADGATWRGVMDEYSKDAPRDTFSQAGFLAAKIFTDAMTAAKEPITRESATTSLKAVKDYESSLLCGPWYFGDADEHNANHSARVVKLTGKGETGFETVRDCGEIPDPDLDAIRAAEQG